MRFRCLIATSVLLCLVMSGCSRRHYRVRADEDAYALLGEKTAGTPWYLPSGYSIEPTPDSRLFDPTNPDAPRLPPPGPELIESGLTRSTDYAPAELGLDDDQARSISNIIRKLPAVDDESNSSGLIRLASLTEELQPPDPEPLPYADDSGVDQVSGRIQPIPTSYWDAVPRNCLARMLEFQSIRDEYEIEFGATQAPPDTDQTLGLSEIIELARRNSREYQTQKEMLYVASLGVSLERYDYYLKFSRRGNGSTLDYSHSRDNGETINRLAIPTAFQLDRMLASGGTFLARFANDVLLTFNGPQGFTADVASELLFDFTQNILQRDVLLEPLIQSERDLVYAARDYSRFRKQFFLDLATSYYNIIRIYRNIEIESQNYFSLVRTVEQAQAEIIAGVNNAPNPVAVDEFEQSMLGGRSSLISVCNELETALDQLKIQMGLPTEMPIDIDLAELNQLTLSDEIEVAFERVQRWRDRAETQRAQDPIDRAELLNASFYLSRRLREWLQLRQRFDSSVSVPPELQQLLLQLDAELSLAEVQRLERAIVPNSAILKYGRTEKLVAAKLELAKRFYALALRGGTAADQAVPWRQKIDRAIERLETLRDRVGDILDETDEESILRLLEDTLDLLDEVNELELQLRRLAGWDANRTEQQRVDDATSQADRLLEIMFELIRGTQTGLPAVNIDANDAMLTALVQRLDMMNERGFLADDWRGVKHAADDLRSVLNFNATHALRTDKNSPFDFDFDDSRTEVRLSVDLPLNRRAERNQYRASLISYQQGRRSVMALEDDIKFEVREGLRRLAETRVQYPISVTQAALAAEQVISTRLQLALGFEGVRYTDLLRALQSSRESLRSVAFARISYLVERANFVFDLELMQLDERGFWPEINDPSYQPTPRLAYPRNAGPTYGQITPWVKPSKLIYQIYRHPLPGERTTIIRSPSAPQAEELPTTPAVE